MTLSTVDERRTENRRAAAGGCDGEHEDAPEGDVSPDGHSEQKDAPPVE
jgi:hypothetical protein